MLQLPAKGRLPSHPGRPASAGPLLISPCRRTTFVPQLAETALFFVINLSSNYEDVIDGKERDSPDHRNVTEQGPEKDTILSFVFICFNRCLKWTYPAANVSALLQCIKKPALQGGIENYPVNPSRCQGTLPRGPRAAPPPHSPRRRRCCAARQCRAPQ